MAEQSHQSQLVSEAATRPVSTEQRELNQNHAASLEDLTYLHIRMNISHISSMLLITACVLLLACVQIRFLPRDAL